MAHEIESMMYAKSGGKPWHGLGVAIESPPATVAAAMELAGLNWTVGKEQLYLANGKAAPRWATVRSSDGAILGTVGDDYQVVQNDRAFAPLEPFLAAGLATVETGGSLRGGSRVWMLLRLNREDSVIVPESDDRISKYLLAAQGHDGSLALCYGPTATRVVCQNTLSVSLRDGQRAMMRLRHTDSVDAGITAATEFVNAMDAKFDRASAMFRALAGRQVTGAQVKAYIDSVFPPSKRAPAQIEAPRAATSFADLLNRPHTVTADAGDAEKAEIRRIHETICGLFEGAGMGASMAGSKGTAWGAYNAVTEYITHHRGASQDNRLNNAWFSDISARATREAEEVFLRS